MWPFIILENFLDKVAPSDKEQVALFLSYFQQFHHTLYERQIPSFAIYGNVISKLGAIYLTVGKESLSSQTFAQDILSLFLIYLKIDKDDVVRSSEFCNSLIFMRQFLPIADNNLIDKPFELLNATETNRVIGQCVRDLETKKLIELEYNLVFNATIFLQVIHSQQSTKIIPLIIRSLKVFKSNEFTDNLVQQLTVVEKNINSSWPAVPIDKNPIDESFSADDVVLLTANSNETNSAIAILPRSASYSSFFFSEALSEKNKDNLGEVDTTLISAAKT